MRINLPIICLVLSSLSLIVSAQDNPCGVDGVVVEASNFQYSPASLEVEVGQTVVWVNMDGTHDVNATTSSIGNTWNNPETFNLAAVSGNSTGVCIGSHTFTVEGTYDYDCSIGQHAANGMVASVVVDAVSITDLFYDLNDVFLSGYAFNAYLSAIYTFEGVETPNESWTGDVDLNGLDNYTVFVPIDSAVDELTELMNLSSFDMLAFYDIVPALKYHVVPGIYMASDLQDGMLLPTAEGQAVTISIGESGAMVNDATIIESDITASNGVIHIVDKILAPQGYPGATTWDVIVQSPDHTILEQALYNEGLNEALRGQPILNDNVDAEGPFTVFAPTDDAFYALAEASGFVNVEALLASPLMDDILYDHLIEAVYELDDLFNGQNLTSYGNNNIGISIDSGAITANSALIVQPNMLAYNGVVHALGEVMPLSPIVSDDLPWIHECSIEDCDSWVFDNGSSISGSPWEDIDLSFECSLEGPAGPYNQWAGGIGDFNAASAMNSTTADNGLLIVDSDLFGADANYDAAWIENSWVQTSSPINCAATENVKIAFQTRYRCWDNGASDDSEKCLVEISRDGINWPDINTFSELDGGVDYGNGVIVPSRWEVFPAYDTNSQTDDPSFVDFDISSAAGHQQEIWIRFRWKGTWGYSWEIDDIIVSELPENDLRIESYVSTTDFLNTGNYELGAIPVDYLSSYQTAAVDVRNAGLLDQSGVQLSLTLDDILISNSSPTTLDYGENITLQASYSLEEASSIGFHEMGFSVASDGPDANPEDNFTSRSIEITEYQMGRDNGQMTAPFPEEATDDFIALNPFLFEEDVTIYGIDVAFVEGSESEAEIVAHLFDPADPYYLSEQYGGLVTSTDVKSLSVDMLNTGSELEVNWYTLTFDNPLTVPSGTPIAGAIETYGGMGVQIWEAQYTYNNTSFTHGPFGSGSAYGWYYTNEVPMIRLNLDPEATNTNNTGCMSQDACNYDPNAEEEDGSCTYPGCTDPSAVNYDSSAGCEAECLYLEYTCGFIGNDGWEDLETAAYPEWQEAVHGVAWSGEWVLNIASEMAEPTTQVVYPLHHFEWTDVIGIPDWSEAVGFELGSIGPNEQRCISAMGIPTAPGMHEIQIEGELFISIFGQPFSTGVQSFSVWLEVSENPNPIPGCMYVTAINYLSYADFDDGSCLFAGCTEESAGNYSPLATIDDGSCGEPCMSDGESSCATDVNYDGAVNVSDLLLLLSEFGANCD